MVNLIGLCENNVVMLKYDRVRIGSRLRMVISTIQQAFGFCYLALSLSGSVEIVSFRAIVVVFCCVR